jgi:hypothetical protein
MLFSVDLVFMLFGSMFWGCIYTAFLTFAIVGSTVFLSVYHVSIQVSVTVDP